MGKKSRAEERESDERRPLYGKTFILPYDRIAPVAPFFSSPRANRSPPPPRLLRQPLKSRSLSTKCFSISIATSLASVSRCKLSCKYPTYSSSDAFRLPGNVSRNCTGGKSLSLSLSFISPAPLCQSLRFFVD